MPTVKYLGTEISVRPGNASTGETAFVGTGPTLRCFLGGLSEAKLFLRERKNGPHYGPREASWEVLLENGSSTMCRDRAAALSSFDYFVRDGRTPRLIRHEHCAHPGCDGHGDITYKPRGWKSWTTRTCPLHTERESTVEMGGE
jgi:hypothetical protein